MDNLLNTRQKLIVERRKQEAKKQRFTLLLISCLIIVSLFAIVTSSAQGEIIGYETVVVRPGDTLWSIAKEHSNSNDIRKVIYYIDGKSETIRPGQIVGVPIFE